MDIYLRRGSLYIIMVFFHSFVLEMIGGEFIFYNLRDFMHEKINKNQHEKNLV